MKKLDTKQKVMVLLLGLLILGSLVGLMFLPSLNGEYSITYRSGCMEKYIGNTISEGNCSIDRAMMEYYMKRQNKSLYFYLNRLEEINQDE